MKCFPECFLAIPGQRPSHLHSLGHRPRIVIHPVFQRPEGSAVCLHSERSALQAFGVWWRLIPGRWPGLGNRMARWAENPEILGRCPRLTCRGPLGRIAMDERRTQRATRSELATDLSPNSPPTVTAVGHPLLYHQRLPERDRPVAREASSQLCPPQNAPAAALQPESGCRVLIQ